ncbi:Sulfite exporter TauE/SafE [Pseudodesulfovibrio hydrargyri]|uniref:Probable membrane transporter protein n=1 Tax=Pseudodesulfovibrio hydrargyri TaxID=2125990 RepID=A0A1J5NIX1_9BACT|nr:sulfite exporter TauE/SafE family protein [Pseudodesulfovibrio hydrargyri]OIQ51625.1 Sulfite exporter TauE/SafE [Pseudodesulfovibrio hydrargyri]
MLETLAIVAIVLAAAFLQGLTGFGFGLIALPLLGFFMGIKTSVPLMVLLAAIISIYLSLRLRKSIDLKSAFTLLAASLIGIPLGVYILKRVPAQGLSICVGVIMVAFTSYQFLARPKPRSFGKRLTVLAGFFSGVLGGSLGVSGPPVIVYTALQPWTKDRAKATLACFFALSNVVIIATHAASGMLTGEVLHLYALCLPALLAGIFLGIKAYDRLSDNGYRQLALALVFTLGCMMLYRNI